MNEKRKPGFYWVKIKGSRWVVAEWDGVQWSWQGCSYPDQGWEYIEEDRLYSIPERDIP
jgi:hypothetical protein